MSPTDHPRRPAWFDISTPDAPHARRFYQELFGWPSNAIDDSYALMGDDGGQPTGGSAKPARPARMSGWSPTSRSRT